MKPLRELRHEERVDVQEVAGGLLRLYWCCWQLKEEQSRQRVPDTTFQLLELLFQQEPGLNLKQEATPGVGHLNQYGDLK